MNKYIYFLLKMLLLSLINFSYCFSQNCIDNYEEASKQYKDGKLCNDLGKLEYAISILDKTSDCTKAYKDSVSLLKNIITNRKKIIQDSLNNQKLLFTKQKISQADNNEARKLIAGCKDCMDSSKSKELYKYLLTNQELEMSQILNGVHAGIQKIDNHTLYADNRLMNLNGPQKWEDHGLSALKNLKISPNETLIGGAKENHLFIKTLKDNSYQFDTTIRVPVFSFDQGSCVYFTNRNSTEDLFCQCKGAKLLHYTFPKDIINAKWRIDMIYLEKSLLVVRQIREDSTIFKLYQYTKEGKKNKNEIEIELKEVGAKVFDNKYSEFTILRGTNEELYFSAFNSDIQRYDIFKITLQSKKIGDSELVRLENFKLSDNSIIYYRKGGMWLHNLGTANEKDNLISNNAEPNFDLANGKLCFWEKTSTKTGEYEWELKMYDLKEKRSKSLWFKLSSNIDNPPTIYAFDNAVICHDQTNKKYHYLDIRQRLCINDSDGLKDYIEGKDCVNSNK